MITTTIETITPAKAMEYLKRNGRNRRMRPGAVRTMAEAIQRGEWMLTHQGIAFSETGDLLDGQHRLTAIVQAGMSVEVAVSRGVPSESFIALDRGNRRSVADVLGEDKKLIECASLAAAVILVNRTASPAQTALFADVLRPMHEDLIGACSTSRRYMTSAGMRLAACIWLARAKNLHERQQVLDLYAQIARLDVQGMPPVGLALVAQVTNGVASASGAGGRGVSLDGLARGLSVFDPRKAQQSRILVKSLVAATKIVSDFFAARGVVL